MKKLIFLLTIVCGIFLLNGCGTNGANSNGTDAIIGEWISIGDGKGFAKIKITKEKRHDQNHTSYFNLTYTI